MIFVLIELVLWSVIAYMLWPRYFFHSYVKTEQGDVITLKRRLFYLFESFISARRGGRNAWFLFPAGEEAGLFSSLAFNRFERYIAFKGLNPTQEASSEPSPQYTFGSVPPEEWVGLTAEEIDNLRNKTRK